MLDDTAYSGSRLGDELWKMMKGTTRMMDDGGENVQNFRAPSVTTYFQNMPTYFQLSVLLIHGYVR